MITAVYNVWICKEEESKQLYWMALVFGLIRGLGFSNTFRSILFADEQVHLWKYLLAFNLGVEVGQVVIVLLILGVAYVVLELGQLKRKWWSMGLSVIALVLAGWMLVERLVVG